ncbi:MAG: hypothetical protein KAT05_12825 [Spirochaetes bacterium]|nr:hypothetical protein [Spirochaetota bacterium]
MEIYAKPVDEDGIMMQIENGIIYISGYIKCSNPGRIMKPFIKEVQDNILKNEIKSIKINISNIKYLNSSGIKEIVNWALKLDRLPDNQKYSITFLYNSEIAWQETFLSSLVCLNSDLIKKEAI